MNIMNFGRHTGFVTWTKGLKERIREAEKEIQMREIKFRAWDNNTNSWSSEEDMWINGKGIINYVDIPLCSEDGDDIVIEQFTGLKDKNGKEIYEGDIVARDPDKMWGVVAWKDNRQAFIFDLQNGHFVFTSMWSSIKVIGNIHQNPELMEQDNG